MASSTRALLKSVLAKMSQKAPEPVPPVIVHDPAAQGARDLDDPFLDPKARDRAGQLIARAAQKTRDPHTK